MKHKELTNHIQGSFLKKQFLEAFLVQSAYIESLLRMYADYSFFTATDGKSFENVVLNSIREKFSRDNLNDIINFLYKGNLISKEKKGLLNTYKDRRNKVLHDLLGEISKDTLEIELEEICKKGNEIIESKEFSDMVGIIEGIEKNKVEKQAVKIPELVLNQK